MSGNTGYSVSTTLKASTSKFKSEIESAIKKLKNLRKSLLKLMI